MFLLEDGNGAGNSNPLEKPRRTDSLIAVLFSAAVMFYVILSLLSANHAAASPRSENQATQPDAAAVGSVISATR